MTISGRIISALLFAVAVWLLHPPSPCAAESDKPTQEKAVGDTQRADDDKRGTIDSPVIVKVLPTPKTKEETAQNQADRDDQSSANWWMVRLTGLLGLIGLAQAIVFWIQAGRLKATIKKMDEIATAQAADTQATIAAAGRSATAMEQVAASIAIQVGTTTTMAETQREFWSKQMRAYVNPDQCGVWEGRSLDPPDQQRFDIPGYVMNIRNSGNTPAYAVVSWADLVVIDVRNENTLTVPALMQKFPATISPHGNFTKAAWFGRQLTAHEMSDIRTGTRGIYVYGRIEYRDVLDQPRFTNFRLKYVGIWPPGKGFTFNFCEAGNDSN